MQYDMFVTFGDLACGSASPTALHDPPVSGPGRDSAASPELLHQLLV